MCRVPLKLSIPSPSKNAIGSLILVTASDSSGNNCGESRLFESPHDQRLRQDQTCVA